MGPGVLVSHSADSSCNVGEELTMSDTEPRNAFDTLCRDYLRRRYDLDADELWHSRVGGWWKYSFPIDGRRVCVSTDGECAWALQVELEPVRSDDPDYDTFADLLELCDALDGYLVEGDDKQQADDPTDADELRNAVRDALPDGWGTDREIAEAVELLALDRRDADLHSAELSRKFDRLRDVLPGDPKDADDVVEAVEGLVSESEGEEDGELDARDIVRAAYDDLGGAGACWFWRRCRVGRRGCVLQLRPDDGQIRPRY